MRHSTSSNSPAPIIARQKPDKEVLRRLLPYVWVYKWRVFAALGLMLAAKLATVSVPFVLKHLVDALHQPNITLTGQAILGWGLIGLILTYGALRLGSSMFTEWREWIFAKATEGVTRRIALEVFGHLHDLSLRFHLDRQTGGMTRDIERGTRAVQSLVSYSLYSVVPTLVEVVLVLGLLGWQFDGVYVLITMTALVFYITYTVKITEWRNQFRRKMNELESTSASRAIDSLLNYETVKYFNNENFESNRYQEELERLRLARLKSQATLSLLNTGQQTIIAIALVAMLWRATQGVVTGTMTLGDLVMINAFMIQLYLPLNFLGVLYREIKQSLTDLDRMFTLLEQSREVADAPHAQTGQTPHPHPPTVTFEKVGFGYDPKRPILHEVSFSIPSGKTVAVVGASGSGKSTLVRLMYRFYDVQTGCIKLNGMDLRDMKQASLRRQIGIVPQDTVLFNESIGYNIRYGRPDATPDEVAQAAQAAQIHPLIAQLPQGYDAVVGERGLKLSGGEKQRVAIARTLLKNPPILIFDEATSALDSTNERLIQAQLQQTAQNKTTLVIAHRLSTVVDAHEILVLDQGRIVERGTHPQLLAQKGVYERMWVLQQTQLDETS